MALKGLLSATALIGIAGCASPPHGTKSASSLQAVAGSHRGDLRADSASAIESSLRAQLVATDGVVNRESNLVIVTTVVSAIFKSDSHEFAAGSEEVLDRIAAVLMAYPQTKASIQVYSDDLDTSASAASATRLRADAIAAYFVRLGIAPYRLQTRGEVAQALAAEQSTLDERRAERKVEIVISSLST